MHIDYGAHLGSAVASHYARYMVLAGLIPPGQIPKATEAPLAATADLALRYPDDPGAHLLRGITLAKAGDTAGLESELRTALEQAEGLRFYFGEIVEDGARSALAALLHDEGRIGEAKEMARPLCQARDRGTLPEKLRTTLDKARLCD